MMVAHSFDLWKKDSFFSAAEEVQESADVMESAYRMWLKERREGINPADMDEHCRELQTALGTAKWQLEEFERAVRLSHGHSCDDITAARHKQFVAAIENQITRVESGLKEAFSKDGKEPLRWVNLNEAERDDLAMFLSGTSQSLLSMKDEYIKFRPSAKSSSLESDHRNREVDLNLNSTAGISDNMRECRNGVSVNTNSADFVIQVEEEEEIPGTQNDLIGQPTSSTRRTWSSPNFGALKVVVAYQDEQSNKLMAGIEATPKEKGPKPRFWRQRCGEHSQVKWAANLFSQLFGRVGGSQRPTQIPARSQFGRSVQLMLALMLTIFVIVPFVLYSS